MKKQIFYLVVTVITMSLPFASSAQIEKGKFTVGGGVGYSRANSPFPTDMPAIIPDNVSYSNSKATAFSTDLATGYFLSNSLEIGFGAQYRLSKSIGQGRSSAITTEYENKTVLLGGRIFGRYYKEIVQKFYFFSELNSGIENTRSKIISNSVYILEGTTGESKSEGRADRFTAVLMPGVAFFLSQRLSLEATFGGISYVKNFQENHRNIYHFGANFGLQNIELSGRFYF